MIYSVRPARLLVSALVLVTLVFVGCQRSGQSSEAGNEANNAGVQIALQPVLADEIMVVILTDASDAPITGATVALEGNMNHAGMIPVLADPVADDADGSADGHYHLPFTFTMLGDWIITVSVTQADGSSFSRNLDVRARSEGITGDDVMPVQENGSPPASGSGTEDHDHEGETGDAPLIVHEPMARPAPLEGGTGAVYFMLENHGDAAVTLTGAHSPAAAAVELHTTINDNGVMRMRQLTDGAAINPGESIELTPGAMHLMLIDLVAPLAEGDQVEVTLHFTGADDLTFTAPVVNMDDLPPEDSSTEGEHDH